MTNREIDLLVAEYIEGWIAWEEKRGEYLYVVFQKPGEKEPYRSYRDWKANEERFRRIHFREINFNKHVITNIPYYSTDISDAWPIVEKLKIAIIPQSDDAPDNMKYLARIERFEKGEGIEVFAETAPLAICLAALKLKGVSLDG